MTLILKNALSIFPFGLSVLWIHYRKRKTANHIRSQVLRCGTSASPNYAEACDAESRADFIHKLKIVLKELRETKVWLTLVVRAEIISPGDRLEPLIQECDELISIFVKSVKTAKANLASKRHDTCKIVTRNSLFVNRT